MLNSARGISDKDVSPQAQAARWIGGFADLDGLQFVARIDVGSDANDELRNEIRAAVTPDQRDYAAVMGQYTVPAMQQGASPPTAAAALTTKSVDPRPAWARSGRGRAPPIGPPGTTAAIKEETEPVSPFVSRLVLVLLLASANPSYALDVRNPDPVSVVAAAFAAQNVGNIEAAAAFYTDDALITNTRGRAMPPGKEGVRRFHEANRAANVQFSLGPNPKVDGNKIILRATTTIAFFEKVGLGLVEVGNVIIVEDNRINSFQPYYPLRAVARIGQACWEHGANVPFFGRPCSEFVEGAIAHTAHLITEGILGEE